MTTHYKPKFEVAVTAVSIVGVMFILAGLIWLMNHYAKPGEVDQTRWAERTRNLSDLRAQTKDQLDNYAFIDQKRDVVRLPIDRAMELTILESKDPVAGRAKLLARLERATPPAPATTNAAPATNAAPVTNFITK